METNADKDLPLFEAIRTYSDSTGWAELGSLLAVKGDSAEKDGWSAQDWAIYDLRIKLPLGLAFPGSDSPALFRNVPAWHRWVRLRTAFHQQLQSGDLVATGYVKPVELDDSRKTIPADKWAFLELDFQRSAASGGGTEIIAIRVSRAVSTGGSPPETSPVPAVKGRRRGGPRTGKYVGHLDDILEIFFEKRGGLKFFDQTTRADIRREIQSVYPRRVDSEKYPLPGSRSQIEKRIKEFVERKTAEAQSRPMLTTRR